MLPAVTNEQSKAVQSLSNFGVSVVQAASQLAGYMGRILGTVPEDTVGLVIGDPLHAVRTIIAAKLDSLVTKKLQARNVEITQPVSPSLAIPLLRAAYDENRPVLQELWASLIAAAMDPARSSWIRQSFIEVVKRFDPLDALILQSLYNNSGSLSPNSRDFLANSLQVSAEEVMISAQNLVDFRCAGYPHAQLHATTFFIVPYGRALIRACSD